MERADMPNNASLRAVAGAALAVLALAGPAAAQAPGGAPPGVTVAPVAQRDVSERWSFTGRVQAIDKVELRARVQGFLAARNFEEGTEVKTDDLLFEIEKAPYQAAVAQAEANLASATAAEQLAQATLSRTETLSERQTVSAAQLDEAQAKFLEAQAAAQAAEAALTRARLDLAYTDVRAPMAGRIGRAAYSVGDLVGPDSGPLATLVAQDPIYVAFPVPSRVLLEVRREGRARESVRVHLELADGSTYEHAGEVSFVEVEANPTTDTVTVHATVPNPDRLLVDRQLVGVTVEAKEPTLRLVVSQSALLLDQQGAYVLVVGDDDTVATRRVALGEQVGTDVIVEDGLAAGERVIVAGVQKVRPGMTVSPQTVKGDDESP
jgi:membrane fusion protein (multidrug efflux system)